MRLYVGNLPYSTTDPQLMELFSPFGARPLRVEAARPRRDGKN